MARPKTIDPLLIQTFDLQPSKGDIKKLEIIEAAIRCIAKYGMEGGTLNKVGELLKIRRSHVAYYFPDHDRLLEAVIQYVITVAQKTTIEALKKADSPQARILAMVDGAFDWAENYPEQAQVLLLFFYYCSVHPSFRKLQAEIRKAGQARIQAILLERSKAGVHAREAEARAKAIQSLITGCIIEALATLGVNGLPEFRRIAKSNCATLAGPFFHSKAK